MSEETKSSQWFKDNVIEDTKELIEIGKLANKEILENFAIEIYDPMTTIAMYGKIFDSICEMLIRKQKDYDNICLNIAGRLNIGYTSTTSEDDEKMGNFMIFMQHIDHKASDKPLDEDEDDTIKLCTQWNAVNIKTQSEILKEISVMAMKNISEMINLKLESHEFILPFFCTTHSAIVKYAQLKRSELDMNPYEMNIAGLYTIGVSVNENAEEEVYYIPSISSKLSLKSDLTADRHSGD